MLLKLSGLALRPLSAISSSPFIGRLTESSDLPTAARTGEILRIRQPIESLPPGFRAYLLDTSIPESVAATERDVYVVAPELQYLSDGDIVRLNPTRRMLAALYRRSSPNNTFLVTERCDNYCLMCSQPPKARDDSWLVDELMELIPLVSPDTQEIGITGGEPGLLGTRLIDLMGLMKQALPRTGVHILSNGRSFANAGFANSLARVDHHDLVVGIPLYSDLPEEHDYVVQANGAFEDTIAGILNLKRAGVRVELRFVIHAQTHARLAAFARFVVRNLCFVDHVALMGLELVGFAKTNLDSLWIDPLDYQDELTAAALALSRAGLVTSIYNHPLCVLPLSLHSFARQSISDWKNLYLHECSSCARKDACSGLFASATVRRSRGIRAFPASADSEGPKTGMPLFRQ